MDLCHIKVPCCANTMRMSNAHSIIVEQWKASNKAISRGRQKSPFALTHSAFCRRL